jgi:hypothetical protein
MWGLNPFYCPRRALRWEGEGFGKDLVAGIMAGIKPGRKSIGAREREYLEQLQRIQLMTDLIDWWRGGY